MAIETLRLQVDPMPWGIVMPPTYAVSALVGKSKAQTSRESRQRFPWIKKLYWRNAGWSVGFVASPAGGNEDVIKREVEVQEKVDTGKVQLDFGFEVPSATGVSPWVSTAPSSSWLLYSCTKPLVHSAR